MKRKKFLKITTFLLAISCLFASANAQEKKSENVTKGDVVSKQNLVNGFADLIEDLLPTVVNISTVQEVEEANNSIDQMMLNELSRTPLFDDFRKHLENQFKNGQKKKISSIGSGFIISKDGLIVTNNHVIADATEITVSTSDGLKYKAKIIGFDKKTDLALLKINANKELKFAKFGDSTKSRIGDWVIVIGNPYDLGGSVSVGIVSARGRDINNGQSDEFIQTDAAINKGNSGGPMFNAKGEVIGISTAIFSPSGGNVGIGFATPSSTASQIVKQLKDQGGVTRGWIGVSVQDISEELAESIKMSKPKGAFVMEVVKDGPADKAGIVPSDIIVKFDNVEIDEMKILPKTVSNYQVGKVAKITIMRQGKLKTLEVKIDKMPNENQDVKKSEIKIDKKQIATQGSTQILGMGLVEFKSKIKKDQKETLVEGLLVTDVSPKSEASEKQISAGDVIISINQIPVSSIAQLKKNIEEISKTGKKLFLFIKRGDNNYATTLNIK